MSHPSIKPQRVVTRWKRGRKVCRISLVQPSAGDVFYLRALLIHRAAESWEDLRTVREVLHGTYEEAAKGFVLFETQNEGVMVMQEMVDNFRAPSTLRFLFVQLILEGSPAVTLWEQFQADLMKDFIQRFKGNQQLAETTTLQHIGRLLLGHGKALEIFGLPKVDLLLGGREAEAELQRFCNLNHYKDRAAEMKLSLNEEQTIIYDDVLQEALGTGHGHQLLFIEGKAGHGKTYLVTAICNAIRGAGRIVLPCGSTALSALLYEGGRTAHSLFCLPVKEDNTDMHSTVTMGDPRCGLIQEAIAIVWEELPMANKVAIDATDELLRMVCSNDLPFGGKLFIGVGDFRQVAPVVKGAGRTTTIDASVKPSHLWKAFSQVPVECSS